MKHHHPKNDPISFDDDDPPPPPTPDFKALLEAAHQREGALLDRVSALERELAAARKAVPADVGHTGRQLDIAVDSWRDVAASRTGMMRQLELVLRAKVRRCEYGVEPEGGWSAWVDACWELGLRTGEDEVPVVPVYRETDAGVVK